MAAAALGLDEPGAGTLVAERVANGKDMALQDFRLNVNVAPERGQQFIVADQSARVLDQITENVESLAREVETLVHASSVPPPHAQICDIDPKCRRLCHIGHATDFP